LKWSVVFQRFETQLGNSEFQPIDLYPNVDSPETQLGNQENGEYFIVFPWNYHLFFQRFETQLGNSEFQPIDLYPNVNSPKTQLGN